MIKPEQLFILSLMHYHMLTALLPGSFGLKCRTSFGHSTHLTGMLSWEAVLSFSYMKTPLGGSVP